jgi:hypothetical protein
MPDPTPADQAVSANAHVCSAIGRAVGSLWQRQNGVRPDSVHTEYVDNVVRCRIEGHAETDATAAAGDGLGTLGYQRLAQAAVSDLTGRTVTGFVAKRVKAGQPATNTFILEPPQTRY